MSASNIAPPCALEHGRAYRFLISHPRDFVLVRCIQRVHCEEAGAFSLRVDSICLLHCLAIGTYILCPSRPQRQLMFLKGSVRKYWKCQQSRCASLRLASVRNAPLTISVAQYCADHPLHCVGGFPVREGGDRSPVPEHISWQPIDGNANARTGSHRPLAPFQYL